MENKAGNGIQCPRCKQKIYSEYTHDFHYCDCGYCFVDGGYSYLRYGWSECKFPGFGVPKIVKRPKTPVKSTKFQLAKEKKIKNSFKKLAGRTKRPVKRSDRPTT